jgi:hypothetical protein
VENQIIDRTLDAQNSASSGAVDGLFSTDRTLFSIDRSRRDVMLKLATVAACDGACGRSKKSPYNHSNVQGSVAVCCLVLVLVDRSNGDGR